MYDIKLSKHQGKLEMHWLGMYVINSITIGMAVQLQHLDGAMFPKMVNDNRINPYKMG